MRRILAEPVVEAIDLIGKHAPDGVVEIGAGTGLWLEAMQKAGILCVGYDIYPQGPLVALGDHFTASRHKDLALLIVWPPDGPEIESWLEVWSGDIIIICGAFERFDNNLDQCLSGYDEVARLQLPAGVKGRSDLKVFKRKTNPSSET